MEQQKQAIAAQQGLELEEPWEPDDPFSTYGYDAVDYRLELEAFRSSLRPKEPEVLDIYLEAESGRTLQEISLGHSQNPATVRSKFRFIKKRAGHR